MTNACFFNELKMQSELIANIRRGLASKIGIVLDVNLMEKKSLELFEAKVK